MEAKNTPPTDPSRVAPAPPQPPVISPKKLNLLMQPSKIGLDCPFCNEFQAGRKGLERHLLRERTDPRKCRVCYRTFDGLTHLILDLRVYAWQKAFVCPFCKERFATVVLRTKHLQNSHPDGRFFECLKCKKFIIMSDERVHKEERCREAGNPVDEDTASPFSEKSGSSTSTPSHREGGETRESTGSLAKSQESLQSQESFSEQPATSAKKQKTSSTEMFEETVSECWEDSPVAPPISPHSQGSPSRESSTSSKKQTMPSAVCGKSPAPSQDSQESQNSQASSAQSLVSSGTPSETAEQEGYQCSKCGTVFEKEEDRCAHVLEKSETADKCPDCIAERWEMFQKRVHWNLPDTHFNWGKEKPELCPICDEFCFNRNALGIHWKQHENEENKEYTCPRCFARFRNNLIFRNHYYTHRGIIAPRRPIVFPLVCPECPRSRKTKFFEVEQYVAHMREKHKKVYPLSCPFPECEERCPEAKFLRHIKMNHQWTTVPKCGWLSCMQVFERKKDLKKHRRELTNHDKETVCLLCGAPFGSHGELARHLSTAKHDQKRRPQKRNQNQKQKRKRR